LSDPEAFKQGRTDAGWQAFCQQCKADFKLDPIKDGPLKAAQLLANRANDWGKVWERFAEVPVSYPGVVEWLKRAAPKQATMFDSAEVWPDMNQIEEAQLSKALAALVDRPQGEVIQRITELESQHARRRDYPWQKLGLSPLVTALEPLARLAGLCGSVRVVSRCSDPGGVCGVLRDRGLEGGCRCSGHDGGVWRARTARRGAGRPARHLPPVARSHVASSAKARP